MFRSFLLALSLVCLTATAEAKGGPKNRTFGLGLQLGAPTGITGKVYFGEIPALAFGVGVAWPFGGFGGWVDLDLHFVKFNTKRPDVLTIRLYAGPGLQLGFAGPYYYYTYGPTIGRPYALSGYVGGSFSLAVRGPIGMTIHWTKVAFDTYAELGPAVHVVFDPGVARVFVGFLFAVGARYYF
jgi:hypothetical protein